MSRNFGPFGGESSRLVHFLLFLLLLWMLAVPAAGQGDTPEVQLWLTLLHNNDAESQLLNAGSGLEDFGGVARFATLVAALKAEATSGGEEHATGVLLVSSGDNFLAGPEFNASLEMGPPFFDAIALDKIGYDAIALGNHEFDFGPDVLADFLSGFTSPPPIVNGNLDFSLEARLQELVDMGRIVRILVVDVAGEQVGIVAVTTPLLRAISSPRNVQIDPDIVGVIQAGVDELESMSINKIILLSHLQSIDEDLALIPQIRGVDIAVAGGGDELLANEGDLLIPGDESQVFGSYPLMAEDSEGKMVPVITTSGAYRYVGRLVSGFDAEGNLVLLDMEKSGPVRVSGTGEDAVVPDADVLAMVSDPVAAAVADLAANVIATSEVNLDGLRSGVRGGETNEGNLIADALLSEATRLADAFGVPTPQVALQNGGGIRNDSIIAAGDITELDTFDMLPFTNFVSVVPNIPPEQFKEILENAVSRVEFGDGRFAQISGFELLYDLKGVAQTVDSDGNVTGAGTRVRRVTLNDGTPIVMAGRVVDGAPPVDIATIDFLARGGDQYPFGGAPFTALGVTYQQALRNFIERPVEEGGLGGLISAAQYPEGGEGRSQVFVGDSILYLSQFGDGTSQGIGVASKVFLINLNRDEVANVSLQVKDTAGFLLPVDFNGETVPGDTFLTIPPGALRVLETDGAGDLVIGSVTASADQPIAGVILFDSAAGLVGVPSSSANGDGFVAPIESQAEGMVHTSIAVMNLESEEVTLDLQLLSSDRQLLATASLTLAGMGQTALFVEEIEWVPQEGVMLDFSSFQGLIDAQASGRTAATAIQTRPAEFANLPVTTLVQSQAAQNSAFRPFGLRFQEDGESQTYFAQFGSAAGELVSQILLINRSPDEEAAVTLTLKDVEGNPLTTGLNGEVVEGEVQLMIPPGGLRILETDSDGPLQIGNAAVNSDQPLAGTILFSGPNGVAGVPAGGNVASGFVTPFESRAGGINTGLAIVNLEAAENMVELQLCDVDRNILGTAAILMTPMQQTSLFVDQIEWEFTDGVVPDFNNLIGLVKGSASGGLAAMVVATRPGQFATMPVAVEPN